MLASMLKLAMYHFTEQGDLKIFLKLTLASKGLLLNEELAWAIDK